VVNVSDDTKVSDIFHAVLSCSCVVKFRNRLYRCDVAKLAQKTEHLSVGDGNR